MSLIDAIATSVKNVEDERDKTELSTSFVNSTTTQDNEVTFVTPALTPKVTNSAISIDDNDVVGNKKY
jgi:hypothetical protein